ncbi:hypothetical protein [uncultured Desulfovibrio sp.]|uniref:hypothetical protein n=1 Tax=uncultured Desulfovibrio sp. TaxID=167968 RepID=UPI0026243F4E|nr:hypothetical protein [uncultured Desulfovibrio sp.]
MRHSRTSIINTALMRVGAQGVTAAFQDSPSAQTAAAAYDRSLAYCLSLHPWAFALTRAALARGTEKAAPGWRFCYPLPPDCLRVADAVSMGQWGAQRLSYSLAGGNLQTDADAVTISYVSAKSADFPDAFADALAWRVALEISPYVQQGGNARDYLEMFERALDRARVENDAQQRPGRVCHSSFLRERMVL